MLINLKVPLLNNYKYVLLKKNRVIHFHYRIEQMEAYNFLFPTRQYFHELFVDLIILLTLCYNRIFSGTNCYVSSSICKEPSEACYHFSLVIRFGFKNLQSLFAQDVTIFDKLQEYQENYTSNSVSDLYQEQVLHHWLWRKLRCLNVFMYIYTYINAKVGKIERSFQIYITSLENNHVFTWCRIICSIQVPLCLFRK